MDKLKKQEKQACDYDIIVGGGGAAGLAAAITAAKDSCCSVAVIEKMERPGKKLSVTGNGRCNLSNCQCEDGEAVSGFFRQIGLLTREDEEGRIYPYSEEAGEVTKLLRDTAVQADVNIMTGCRILWVRTETQETAIENGGFVVGIKTGNQERILRCRMFLLATGGKSYGKTGSTGDGYEIARSLGHTVYRPVPALVPVTVKEDLIPIAGVRQKALVRLYRGDICVWEEAGEIQFNRRQLSGICILNLSGELKLDGKKPLAQAFSDYMIHVDLVPHLTENELLLFLQRKANFGDSILETLIKRKMADWLLGQIKDFDSRNPEHLKEVCRQIKNLTFHVTGTKGWDEAQVTRGGVALDQIRMDTMESTQIKGLYFAGEVTDYNGPCGGYNLHYAWLSGIRAGKDMARHV